MGIKGYVTFVMNDRRPLEEEHSVSWLLLRLIWSFMPRKM